MGAMYDRGPRLSSPSGNRIHVEGVSVSRQGGEPLVQFEGDPAGRN
jgi:hypothetical protein